MSDHPITPPPELVKEWWDGTHGNFFYEFEALTTQAARWGADQELEACCEWLQERGSFTFAEAMSRDRRPEPPSLKERALQAWTAVEEGTDDQAAMAVIRRALEQLDD